jgi:predicted GIY-YIG superfamily endonuclease
MQGQIPTQKRHPAAHATITRPARWVYILKLTDGSFYVGQTTDLVVRMKEHADGIQRQTKGRSPGLVYFERFEGDRDLVRARENELTLWNRNTFGQRRLRQLIEAWQAPLRLVKLDS